MTTDGPDDAAGAASPEELISHEVAARLADAASGAEGVWDVEVAVRAMLESSRAVDPKCTSAECQLVQAALDAIEYRLSFGNGRCELLPHLTFADGTTQPLAVEAQGAEVVARWQSLHESVKHFLWRGRLGRVCEVMR